MRDKNRTGPGRRRPLTSGGNRRRSGAPIGAPPRRESPPRRPRDFEPAPRRPLEPPSRRARPAPPKTRDATPAEGVAFGFHAVRTALEQHPRRVERVLLARDLRDGRTRQLVALARQAGVPFQQAPRQALERLAQGLPHQGVAARLSGTDLLTEDELIEKLPERPIVLVLDGVQDPRNLGAILRTAAAFGVAGVFLPGHRAAGVSPAAVRTAAGGVDLVPVARAGNLTRLLAQLKERGLTPVALDVHDARPPWDVRLDGPIALVAGGEEKGVRASVLEACGARVWAPIRAELGALNVSVAVGIVLAEALRQRITDSQKAVTT